jgi:hypothetical protein
VVCQEGLLSVYNPNKEKLKYRFKLDQVDIRVGPQPDQYALFTGIIEFTFKTQSEQERDFWVVLISKQRLALIEERKIDSELD